MYLHRMPRSDPIQFPAIISIKRFLLAFTSTTKFHSIYFVVCCRKLFHHESIMSSQSVVQNSALMDVDMWKSHCLNPNTMPPRCVCCSNPFGFTTICIKSFRLIEHTSFSMTQEIFHVRNNYYYLCIEKFNRKSVISSLRPTNNEMTLNKCEMHSMRTLVRLKSLFKWETRWWVYFWYSVEWTTRAAIMRNEKYQIKSILNLIQMGWEKTC